MVVSKDFANFLNEYVDTLSNLDYKIVFFNDLSDKAYIEMAQLLPNLNLNLKKMVSGVEEIAIILKKYGLSEDELSQVNHTLIGLKNIPKIILEIMTSLQVQDAVKQCISHITSTIQITNNLISKTSVDVIDNETYSTIKYLKIMPELIIAQLDNIYNKMNDNLCFLPDKFQALFEILRPTITLEKLLANEKEKNNMEILKEELNRIKSNLSDGSNELKEKLTLAIEKVTELEKELPKNTKMLDLSAAAPRSLQQPLTEILFLNENLRKASLTAESILDRVYNDDPEKIDCRDKILKIAELFSTRSEIEVARTVLKGITLEETGKEGELELF